MFVYIIPLFIIIFFFKKNTESFKNSNINNSAYSIQINNLEKRIKNNIINKISDINKKINIIYNNMEKNKNSKK